MFDQKISAREYMVLFRRTFRLLNQLAPGITLIQFLQSLFQALIPFIAIYMTAKILNEMVTDRDIRRLILYVILTISAELLAVLMRGIFNFFQSQMKLKVSANQEILMTNKTYALSYEMSEDKEITELRKLIESNAEIGVGSLFDAVWFSNNFFRYASAVCIAIAMGAGMFTGAPWWTLALLFLLVAASIGVLTIDWIKVEKVVRNFLESLPASKALNDFYMASYMEDDKAAKDIRIFSQSAFLEHELEQKMYTPQFCVRQSQIRTEGNHSVLTVAFTGILGGVVYLFVAFQAWNGHMDVGDVLRYYGCITQLISAAASLIVAVSGLTGVNYSNKLLFRYLDLPEESHSGGKPMTNAAHSLTFHGVSFRYSPELSPALDHIDLYIQPGEHVAIVGRNGSGKTTLAKLLCRLYRPDEGVILVDGLDASEYDHNTYRQNIAAVFQDFKLFSFGVGENIAGQSQYDPEAVWNALELAGIRPRVEALPKKLETSIYRDFEEDGVEFSGGEEQKLAIARALYKNAPILILDEPTAALDPFSEAEIYEKFEKISKGKTVIYISHRLSSCKFCDRILVMENGRIVQNGSHEELLAQEDGTYAELWFAQAQYYKK